MRAGAVWIIGLLVVFSVAATAEGTFVVGIEQEMRAEWAVLSTTFEVSVGVSLSIEPYPRNTLAQEIVLQSIAADKSLHFITVAREWAGSVTRYLVDLSEAFPSLSSYGVDPVVVDGRVIGVPISFAPDWFLAVLDWPEDRDSALELLIAVSGAAATGADRILDPDQAIDVFSTQKIAAGDHDPRVDGALESLLGAARAILGNPTPDAFASATPIERAAIETIAARFGIPIRTSDGTVTVALVLASGITSSARVGALEALGGAAIVTNDRLGLIRVELPLSRLTECVDAVEGVALARPPYVAHVVAVSDPSVSMVEGTAEIGAEAFHEVGLTGEGVRVAVIDLGFAGLGETQARGELPFAVVQEDLTGDGLASGTTHGTASAAAIHSIAPDAELTLIRIEDEFDLDRAVSYCIERGIDVIHHALAWFNTNVYDGTGAIAAVARRAIDAGILWVNAAGDQGSGHWVGDLVDANLDGWHDTGVGFVGEAGSEVSLYLTWDDGRHTSIDVDLYLLDPTGTIMAASTKHQTGTEAPTESLRMFLADTGTYTVRLHAAEGTTAILHVIGATLDEPVSAGSIVAPADVAEVLAIGDMTSATSSRGPTHDGRSKPDLCAPGMATAGEILLLGSSASAAYATAAAALLLGQQPTLDEPALRARLLEEVEDAGDSALCGAGRLALSPPPPPNEPPSAAFGWTPASPQVGGAVAFDASDSSDPDGGIVDIVWAFGDGGTARGVTVTHVFETPGAYDVAVTVTDTSGDVATLRRVVAVVEAPQAAPAPPASETNRDPVAAITHTPVVPAVGVTVQFSGSGSIDPDGAITSYSWEFGDGTFSSGLQTSHAYQASGTFTVLLTVADDRGAQDVVAKTITVVAAAALPSSSAPTTPETPPSAASSTAPGVVRIVSTPSGASIMFDGLPIGNTPIDVPDVAAGTHTIQAWSTGYDAMSLEIEVGDGETRVVDLQFVRSTANRPPTVRFSAQPQIATAGAIVLFDARQSRDDIGIATYTWEFGDGATAQGSVVPHFFSEPGTYTVRLTVTDTEGAAASAEATILVFSAPSGTAPRAVTPPSTHAPASPAMTAINAPPTAGYEPTSFAAAGLYVYGIDRWHITVSAGAGWAKDRAYRLEMRTDDAFSGIAADGASHAVSDGGRTLVFEGTIRSGTVDHSFSVAGSSSLWLHLALDANGDGTLDSSSDNVYLRGAKVNPPANPFVVGVIGSDLPVLVPSSDFRIGTAMSYTPSLRLVFWSTSIRALEQ